MGGRRGRRYQDNLFKADEEECTRSGGEEGTSTNKSQLKGLEEKGSIDEKLFSEKCLKHLIRASFKRGVSIKTANNPEKQEKKNQAHRQLKRKEVVGIDQKGI